MLSILTYSEQNDILILNSSYESLRNKLLSALSNSPELHIDGQRKPKDHCSPAWDFLSLFLSDGRELVVFLVQGLIMERLFHV